MQHKPALVPFISEFAAIKSWPAADPLPPMARTLSTPPVGNIASEGFVTIGIHRDPEIFVQEALCNGFPGRSDAALPCPMREAVLFSAEHDPMFVARHRSEEVRRLVAMARDLAPVERELKSNMSDRRRKILGCKRLKLMEALLAEIGSRDVDLAKDVADGFDLVGKLPESHVFSRKLRPASLAPESLRNIAPKARAAVLASVRSSGDAQMDRDLYQVTLAERDKGFLEGPVDPDSIPFNGTVTRRFGVLQKGKLRPIGDYRASLVNSSVTQTEMVTIHGIDHIAALGSMFMTSLHMKGRRTDLVAKCWDLSGAYKQLALSDPAFELDSYLVVWDPDLKRCSVFKQKVLPFGSIASVTGFLRYSHAVWAIGCRILKLCWSSYFDDFLHLESSLLKDHADMCVQMLFDLLGWKLSAEKLLPYHSLCKVLGVELDLSKTPDLVFDVANTESRKRELVKTLDEVLSSRKLSRHDSEKLRGRLQFASGQLFGRRIRNCMNALNAHAREGRQLVDDSLAASLEVIKFLIANQRPRQVTVSHEKFAHLYVDASFAPGKHSGLGGLLYDQGGAVLGFFSEQIQDETLK